MSDPTEDIATTQTELLLTNYRFDLKHYTAKALISQWLQKYPALWIRQAVLEALYLGRYKADSVEQILNLWLKRQIVTFHYTGEFERLICNKITPSKPSVVESEKLRVPEIRDYFTTEELSPFSFKLKKVVGENLESSQTQEHPVTIFKETEKE